MASFWSNLDWLAVVVIALTLAAICFLAVLWSRREWKSRKIRVGVFLEREYDGAGNGPSVPAPDDEDTLILPKRKE